MDKTELEAGPADLKERRWNDARIKTKPFKPSLEDLAALKNLDKEPGNEMKSYLEEIVGKSYEKITMGEINKIFPGIYDDLFLAQIPTVLEIYQDLRKQVFG